MDFGGLPGEVWHEPQPQPTFPTWGGTWQKMARSRPTVEPAIEPVTPPAAIEPIAPPRDEFVPWFKRIWKDGQDNVHVAPTLLTSFLAIAGCFRGQDESPIFKEFSTQS